MAAFKPFHRSFSPFLFFFTALLCLPSSPALPAKKKGGEAPVRYESLSSPKKIAYLSNLLFLGKWEEAAGKMAQGEPPKLDNRSKRRFTLLKAYTDLKQGRPGEAEAQLDSLSGNYPELERQLPFWRAQAARLAGHPQKAAVTLEQLCGGPCVPANPEPAPSPKTSGKKKSAKPAPPPEAADGEVAPRVVREYASALCETGEAGRGQEIFQKLLSGPEGAERNVARLAFARCLEKSGNPNQATEELRSLFVQAPGSLSRREIEQALPQGFSFSQEDLSLRISNLKTQERWGEAADELKDLLSRLNPAERAARRNETADTFFKARDYREAAELYEEIATDPSLTDRGTVLEKLGSAYARSNQFDKALKVQRELEAASADDPGSSQKISYKIAFLLADAGRCQEAAQAFQEFFDRFPKSPKRDDALWQKGWCEYRLGQWEKAQGTLGTLLDEFPKSPYAARASYWRYRISAILGPSESAQEAKALFLEKYAENFYDHWDRTRRGLETNQCPTLSLNASFPEGHPPSAIFSQFSEPDRTALVELLALGLWEDFMEIYRKGGGNDVASFDELKKWIRMSAEREGVSEDLIWAVMREESRFKAGALSSAGARGLMQIIPQTGYEIARSLNWSSFQPSDLYQPIVNLRMGIHYLGMLLKKFSGNTVYTIAAYNAGPEAVARWDQQRQSRPCEDFIEEIPYQETYLYVKKVMRSLWNFRENPTAFYAGE